MAVRILVLNDESLAALSNYHDVLMSGFKLNESLQVKSDFLRSLHYNRLVNPAAILGEGVSFDYDDICNNQYSQYSAASTAAQQLQRDAAQSNLLHDCEFYSISTQVNFDHDFICQNFDGILFFFNKPLSCQHKVSEAILSLLAKDKCPPFVVCNVRLNPQEFATYRRVLKQARFPNQAVLEKGDYHYCGEQCRDFSFLLHEVLPKAKAITFIDDQSKLLLADFYSESFRDLTLNAQLLVGHNAYLNFHRNATILAASKAQGLILSLVEPQAENVATAKAAAQEAAAAAATATTAAAATAGVEGVGAAAPDCLNSFKAMPLVQNLAERYGVQQELTIGISSNYFVKLAEVGLSPVAVELLERIHSMWPKSKLVLLLGEGVYSFLQGRPELNSVIVDKGSELSSTLALSFAQEINAALARHQHVRAYLKEQQLPEATAKGLRPLAADAERDDLFTTLGTDDAACVARPAMPLQISKCCVSFGYQGYIPDDLDVLFTDKEFEQLLAATKGIPSVFVEMDPSLQGPMPKEYFLGLMASEFDFFLPPPLKEQITKLYEFSAAHHSLEIGRPDLKVVLPPAPNKATVVADAEHATTATTATLVGLRQLFPRVSLGQLFSAGDLKAQLLSCVSSLQQESLQAFYQDCLRFDGLFTKVLAAYVPHAQALLERKTVGAGAATGAATGAAIANSAAALMQVAQQSNYTYHQRYELHWQYLRYFMLLAAAARGDERLLLPPNMTVADIERALNESALTGAALPFFKPMSLKVLSFGCSRGQEALDLMHYFPCQDINGVDVSPDAINVARRMQSMMQLNQGKEAMLQAYAATAKALGADSKTSIDLASLVNQALNSYDATGQDLHGYQGAVGGFNFVTASELLQQDVKESFDIITAMTVLCRHPETMALHDASQVYPFAEFSQLLVSIDGMLKVGGLLCIFNSNYSLEDTALADKYVRLFPLMAKPQRGSMNMVPADTANVAAAAATTTTAATTTKDFALFAKEALTQLSAAVASTEGSPERAASLVVPHALEAAYNYADAAQIYGHVAHFNAEGQRVLQGKGSIFMKVR